MLCSGLFEIGSFSVQMIFSGFKVIEAGIFFTQNQTTFRNFYSSHTDIFHNFDTNYVEGFVQQNCDA